MDGIKVQAPRLRLSDLQKRLANSTVPGTGGEGDPVVRGTRLDRLYFTYPETRERLEIQCIGVRLLPTGKDDRARLPIFLFKQIYELWPELKDLGLAKSRDRRDRGRQATPVAVAAAGWPTVPALDGVAITGHCGLQCQRAVIAFRGCGGPPIKRSPFAFWPKRPWARNR